MRKQYYICRKCAKDKSLKSYIEAGKNEIQICSICQEEEKCLVIDENMKNLIRTIIRYNYSEFEYHDGGADWLLKRDEEIIGRFKHRKYMEEEIKPRTESLGISSMFYSSEDLKKRLLSKHQEDVINKLVGGGDDGENIYLYNGRSGERGDYFWLPIKEEESYIWEDIRKRICITNAYEIEEHLFEILEPLLLKLEKGIPKGSKYFRARIGANEKGVIKNHYDDESIQEIEGYLFEEEFKRKYPDYKDDQYTYINKLKFPFKNGDIGAPPIELAGEGRTNRAYISYLYLAGNIETCIGEVKPSPGQYLSIGKFITLKSMKIVDLSFIDLSKFCENEQVFENLKCITDIQKEFLRYAVPEERSPYMITQIVCDIIRRLGYDGVMYDSVVTKGLNLVFFNYDNLKYMEDSEELIKIDKVYYEYSLLGYKEVDDFGVVEEEIKERKKSSFNEVREPYDK